MLNKKYISFNNKKKNLTDAKLLNGGVYVHFLYMFQAIFLMIILIINIFK